ncbi:MAG: calcium-translocating P-type ATPase, PMCA-type [Clostridia bacterium]|nr:calcium-translocating P-type ATPase, PMCA-type [Clostridia bacterium]
MAQENKRPHRGLTPEEVLAARERHGANIFTKRAERGFWRCFLTNLGDPVIKVLLLALVLHLIMLFRTGDWIETVGIALSVVLATLISTLSEYRSEAAFARLGESCGAEHCRVLRSGGVCEIPADEVVVGDILLLCAGEKIPADGLLLSGALTVDQSPLTGESREIEKRPTPACKTPTPESEGALFSGCTVHAGEGEMLVSAVGDATYLGGISGELQEGSRESPLKARLTKLAGQISRIGYAAALFCALAFLFHAIVIDAGFKGAEILARVSDIYFLAPLLLDALTLALTVVVMAVPEGLPMMIAVVLSSNIRRMVRDRVLVRKPAGLEAAGGMNILFTDKTGTLTAGHLSLSLILTQGGDYNRPHALLKRAPRLFDYLLLSAHANSGSVRGERDRRPAALGGNATDRALLSAFLDFAPPDYVVTERLAFDSVHKYAAVRLASGEVLVSGAPERLLPMIDGTVGGGGERLPFSARAMMARVRERTERGERVIFLCIGDTMPEGGVRCRLSLLAALCFTDPVRPEARDAVRTLQGAGVQVVMITGDAKETAKGIAAACGILRSGGIVLDGEELAALSDDAVKEILPRLAVVARALPADKSRLVRLAAALSLVVGMTGDGINDAPALKAADVGFAMGSGTQVAKDAGDIVILDDNLASIVRAVLYGRTVFKSIRKFIALQLVINFSAVGISIIGPFIGFDCPVTVVQMLWINLIMDTLGGLAFAGEAPMDFYLKEPPKRRDEPILTRAIAWRVVFLAAVTLGLSVLFLKAPAITALYRESEDSICLLTAFFALFIFAGIFNCLSARTDRVRLFVGLAKNRAFLLIMTAVAAVQIGFVYLGGTVLRTVPLTLRELGITLALAALVLPLGFLQTLWQRLSGKRGIY